jgi:hypothetical protein
VGDPRINRIGAGETQVTGHLRGGARGIEINSY